MASVGDILREARVEQQRSIEDVAAVTKIRPNIIQALESNDLDVLPLPYIKSFVKTYAKLLGVAEREEVRSFLASQQPQPPKVYRTTPPTPEPDKSPKPVVVTKQKPETPPAQPPAQDSGFPTMPLGKPVRTSTINTIVYGGLALGVLVLAYYFLLYEGTESTVVDTPPPATQPIDVGTAGDPQPSVDVAPADSVEPGVVAEQDSLILEARTVAKVWISIVADGKRSTQMTLEPDNTYRWSADSIFTLSLGNAGGIQFTLNGRPLQPMGKMGAIVRNVRITRDGVVSSSTPYSSGTTPSGKQSSSRQRAARQANRSSSVPSITPAETKALRPSLPPPEKESVNQ